MNESKLAFRHKVTGKIVGARQIAGIAEFGRYLPVTDDPGNSSDWMPGVIGPDGQFYGPDVQSHPASKIIIDLPPDAAMELDQLMRQTGDNPTALFQKSLALYKLAKQAISEGKSVGTASDPESLETRFVGL
jgi:hypothetical protein